MYNLIKNELVKIYKRKNVYILMGIIIIIIIIYNFINPDLNKTNLINSSTDRSIVPLQDKYTNMEQYIIAKVENDFSILYNTYRCDSWQRYALNEENSIIFMNGKTIDIKNDIKKCLKIIEEYDFDYNSSVKIDDYAKAKKMFNEYKNALDSDDWKKFVDTKIKNLSEIKKSVILDYQLNEINIELEIYNYRLKYNIQYGNNIQNEYLDQYRNVKNYYSITNSNIEDKAKVELIKYAIENNIVLDISPSNYNIILNNKTDARNAFIRVFEHFDIIIIIITIYISSITINEEINRGTIKQLFIKPHKRRKILVSKIIACIITIITVMFVVIITQFVVGGIIFGFESYKIGYIGYDYNNQEIFRIKLFNYILLKGLTKLPMYIMSAVLCMLIDILNNNTAISMITSIIIFLLGKSIIADFSKIHIISIVSRFFITNNWDFSIYLFGGQSYVDGINLSFSLIIYMIYLLFILKILVVKFKNKEIYNL